MQSCMHGLLECALFNQGQVIDIWGEANAARMWLLKSNGFIGILAISAWKAPVGFRYRGFLTGRAGLRQREI